MKSIDEFRLNLIADYTTQAVKAAERIRKKVKLLEFEKLYKVKGEFINLCEKDTAFDSILDIELSSEASRWLNKDIDIIYWKIGAFVIYRINQLYGTNLKLNVEWDLAQMPDNEMIFVGYGLSVKMDGFDWENLEESHQREIRIIFDSIDNSKYFLHTITGYFTNDNNEIAEEFYLNHLKARL
jgi:hypothetical protein